MKREFCVSSIDLFKIDQEIRMYLSENNCEPYIFMNENTLSAMEGSIGMVDLVIDPMPNIESNRNCNGINATYAGCKMFINNDLAFGMVEIR